MFVSGDRFRCFPNRVYALVGFSTIIGILFLQIVSLNKTHGGIPEHMLRLATQCPNRTDGFDGQFYLVLAQDPLLLQGSAGKLDAPVYRARRIGLPAFSLIFSLFGLSHAAALIATESFFIVLLTGCITFAAAVNRLPVLIIPAAALSLPFVLSVELVTTELPASVILLFALCALRMSRPVTASLFLGAACLFKEVAILAVVACVLATAGDRDMKGAIIIFGSLIPVGVWNLYLLRAFPDQSLLNGMSGNMCPIPVSGLFNGIVRSADSLLHQECAVKTMALLIISMWILGGIVLAIRMVLIGRSSARMTAVMGAILALFLCYGGESQMYNEIFNFGRQLFLLPVGLLAVFLLERSILRRSDRNILCSWLLLGGFFGLAWWIHHLGVRGQTGFGV